MATVRPLVVAVASVADAQALATQFKVIRRNGAVVPFEPSKITIAMTKAFLAVNGGQGAASARYSTYGAPGLRNFNMN